MLDSVAISWLHRILLPAQPTTVECLQSQQVVSIMALVETAKVSHIVQASLFGKIVHQVISFCKVKQKHSHIIVLPTIPSSQQKVKECSKSLFKEAPVNFRTPSANRSTVSSTMVLTYTMVLL